MKINEKKIILVLILMFLVYFFTTFFFNIFTYVNLEYILFWIITLILLCFLVGHRIDKYPYKIDSSDLMSYTYGYVVKVLVSANELGEENKILYKEEEVLKENSSYKSDTGLILINENILLDYQKYNDIITSFKKNYILAMDSKLTINITINIVGEKDGIDEVINNSYTFTTSMPLSEQTVNITNENNTIKNSNMIAKYNEINNGKYNLLSKVIYLIDILFLIFVIYIIVKFLPRKNKYNKLVSKILKNYNEMIVTIKKPPKLDKNNLIEVDKFSELLDAKEILDKPIIYYESPHKDSSSFIIYNESETYIYTISAYSNNENK